MKKKKDSIQLSKQEYYKSNENKIRNSMKVNYEENKNDKRQYYEEMAVTIYFKGLWQDFVQFLCQTKKNSIDRIKEMVTKFSFIEYTHCSICCTC